MKSEQINELAAALSKAQGAMVAAQMDAKNPHFGSKYATLASIIDAVRKPLADNGLAFSQMMAQGDNEVILETVLMHSSGQWISGDVAIKSDPSNRGVNEVQALGSALTYYKRYALAAILGISTTDEDDDGNTAQQARQTKSASKAEMSKSAPVNGNIPTSPQGLFTLVNQRVQIPYDALPHLFNAIKTELGSAWSWPKKNDMAGWKMAYGAAIKHAEAKLQTPEPTK